MHWLDAKELQALYPEWQRFAAVRKKLDPDGRFRTPYLAEILG